MKWLWIVAALIVWYFISQALAILFVWDDNVSGDELNESVCELQSSIFLIVPIVPFWLLIRLLSKVVNLFPGMYDDGTPF